MPYNVLSSSGLLSLVAVSCTSSTGVGLCQLAAASAQAWFRESAGQDLFAVGNLEAATLCFKGRVVGCSDGSCPAGGSGDGECVGAPLVCCITIVFTTSGHQGFAWHIVGDSKFSFLLNSSFCDFAYPSSRIGDLSEVHHSQE